MDETVVADISLPVNRRLQVTALLRRGQEEDQSKQQRTKLERELERIRNLYKIDEGYSDR